MSGLQQTAGSLSPLALLSGCHLSNLSPAPEGAPGQQFFFLREPSPLQQKGERESKKNTTTAKGPACASWRLRASHEQQVIMG